MILARIEQIAEGFSEVFYRGDRYMLTKSVFNKGKSIKVFARNLANGDFVSFNFYITKAGTRLKPCEMEEEKVILFLKEYKHVRFRHAATDGSN